MQSHTKILVVDDEPVARKKIVQLLKIHDKSFEIEEAKDGVEALILIPNFKPSIIFLDIEMPILTGFDVLLQLEERPFNIIFQTAREDYAVQAFEQNACDYLVKPFTNERFATALKRALEIANPGENLRNLEKSILPHGDYLRSIVVKQGSKSHIIKEDNVIGFLSKDHYTNVITTEGQEWICDLSLSHLIERLDPSKFLQLHRNNIVNIKEIKSVDHQANMQVTMTSGLVLPVSRSNRQKVAQLVQNSKVAA